MAMNRIKEVKLTNQFFTLPGNFNIKEYFKDSFGKRRTSKIHNVNLEIKQIYINQILEKEIHPSQKLKRLESGNMLVSIKVNELSEIKNWILSMGSKVIVKSPPELSEMVIKDVESVLKLYK